jgi:hypothetical protein
VSVAPSWFDLDGWYLLESEPVTADFAPTFDIFEPVSPAELVVSFDLEGGAVSADYTAEWETLASVGPASATFSWDAREAITADLVVEFDNDGTTVTADYLVSFDLGGTVSQDYAASFNLAGSISASFPQSWSIIAAVAPRSYAPAWDIRNSVTRDLLPTWATIAYVEADFATEYSITDLNPVSADFSPGWDIDELAAVSRDFSPAWLLGFLTEYEIAWFPRTVEGADTWAPGSISSVVASYTIEFSIVESVAADFSPGWEIGEVGEIDGGGDLPFPVTADFTATWDSTSNPELDYAPAWDVLNAVSADQAITWNTTASITKDLPGSWNIAALPGTVARDLQPSWNITAAVSADFSPTWDTIRAVTLAFSPVYSILSNEDIVGIRPYALRMADYPVASRTARVQVVVGSGSPAGITLQAVSETPGFVAVSADALTDANGDAEFTLDFLAVGQSAITFTEPVSGKAGYLLANAREAH